MSNCTELLRRIPQVDECLRQLQLEGLEVAPLVVKDSVREILAGLRQEILSGKRTEIPAMEQLCAEILTRVQESARRSLRPLINATGIILHTNLGRATLSPRAAAAVAEIASSYSNLEYDVAAGQRGLRYAHVEPLLQKLTGAEAALVVNNNAAAVLLILSALGNGREVVVSRGELVEIGGSFRVPEIMAQCGCLLREVGTTNKTHLRDYAQAINEDTFALMKVHTSNYKIVGFTAAVPREELVALGRQHDLPVIEDLGSGAMIDLAPYGILDEPNVLECLQAGIDVLCFSGDKLLGGAQAGIILGKKKYLDQLKSHPLLRAMRVDKMTLAALEETLVAYLDESRRNREIPVLAMLSATPAELLPRANQLQALLQAAGVESEVIASESQIGGGTTPTQSLPSYAVAIRAAVIAPDLLDQRLRALAYPVVGRIWKDQFLLDVRTIRDADYDYLVNVIAEACQ